MDAQLSRHLNEEIGELEGDLQMNSGSGYPNGQTPPPQYDGIMIPKFQRKNVVGIIMFVALLAFEVFNFDTTRFALASLLGDVRFLGLQWASILAIAFCSIDFAGLARLFTPQQGEEEPQVVWYLMGAWLLGATMNAVMTWWAVSLTLLSHEFGNEILSREQLLSTVPIFVATLVWLTRILFIGAFSIAGEHIFDLAGTKNRLMNAATSQRANVPAQKPALRQTRKPVPKPAPKPTEQEAPAPRPKPSRINRRPLPGRSQQMPSPMQARKRDR